MEKQIVGAALRSRKAYELVLETGFDHELSEPSKHILQIAEDYYAADQEATGCDKELVLNAVRRKFPDHQELFVTAVNEAFSDEISLANVQRELVAASLEAVRTRLTAALTRADDEAAEAFMADYQRLRETGIAADDSQARVLHGPQLDLIREYADRRHDFPLYPKRLSDHVGGGIMPQSHIILVGRPESGKSTFGLNLAKGWCQRGYDVLYYKNEDPELSFHIRAIQAFTEAPIDAICKHPEQAVAKANKCGMDKFILHSADPGSVRHLESLVRRHRPRAVVVDQMRNLQVSREDNRTLQLERACQGMRVLGQRYQCVVLSITQAGDSADGKLHLGMGDIEWSNTGVQGTADLIIGMGVDDIRERGGTRMLTFPKNKCNGNKDQFMLRMDTGLCQVS